MAIITEEIGDIFLAPPKSILIHACNARGAWGSGVATAFKKNYPSAYRQYNAHCLSPPRTGSKIPIKTHQANLVGTTLLIPPPSDSSQRHASKKTTTAHYIACLFTSQDYGKRVSPADEILTNTENALKDLARQVGDIRSRSRKTTSGEEEEEEEEEEGDCYAVRLNSGKFGVQWAQTKAVLEAGELDITILRPESDGAAAAGAGSVRPLVTSSRGGKGKGKGSMPTTTTTQAARAEEARRGPVDKQEMVGVKRGRHKADDEAVRENGNGKGKGEGDRGQRVTTASRGQRLTKRTKLGLEDG